VQGLPTHFLRALISDVRSHRLLRVDLPLPVLRVAKRAGLRHLGELRPLQGDTEFEGDRLDLPLADFVGHGPVLLVSHSHPTGARVVVWVE